MCTSLIKACEWCQLSTLLLQIEVIKANYRRRGDWSRNKCFCTFLSITLWSSNRPPSGLIINCNVWKDLSVSPWRGSWARAYQGPSSKPLAEMMVYDNSASIFDKACENKSISLTKSLLPIQIPFIHIHPNVLEDSFAFQKNDFQKKRKFAFGFMWCLYLARAPVPSVLQYCELINHTLLLKTVRSRQCAV